ncbi:ATP-dependent DNA helicase RecQ [Litorimonas taeanensis]|uniref:DNA helicase RecQ n=1 Tax=Litorimonas taeanensis TaxID=568099 RepID=A0A420WLF1_9PROT|nr:DNA helicase RecQ [Litorimonas taeanensis]RKQ71853.1 ATP-dependent DNA helicase RecQ [Litorimonas taeanensis]
MANPRDILKAQFGFDEFRPGQEGIISKILEGQPVLAVMPTGAGKSLCYQVPSQILDGPTIVVSPLVALMDNQVAGLRANGIMASCLHSGQSREDNITQWRDVTTGRSKILYVSPERLMTDRMLSAMKALKPALFVVDEAHCVSKWGPAFRPEYADLNRLHQLFPETNLAAFTATADEATRQDISTQLFGQGGEIIVHGFDRPNLSLAVMPVDNRPRQINNLLINQKGNSGIVYCLSRKSTETYAQSLRQSGYKALAYHAGMTAEARYENLERFMAEPGIIMVATIAFGMGIDKPDIRFVYHVNMPSSMEAYYQEIGRAGRDGLPAETVLLFGLDDIRLRRQFITNDGSERDHQMREFKRLDALIGYCETTACRKQALLHYFGETIQPCGNCDNCLNPPEQVEASQAARAIIAAIEQTGQRFGTAHIVSVARGEDTPRIHQFNHDKLPAFGRAKDLGKAFLQALIRQAVARGVLGMDISRYGALTLTGMSEAISSGQPFNIRPPMKSTAKAERQARASQQADMSDKDQSLMIRLKSRRSELARELGKPAFVVFSDATLMDMVAKRPTSREDMLGVSGVGETKFARFGEAFLDILLSE